MQMQRLPRPSEVHRLTAPPQQPEPEHDEAPARRAPRWLVALSVLALAALLGGLGLSSGGDAARLSPGVDVVTEDDAVAALAIFGAEAEAVARVAAQRDVFASPGPSAAARSAEEGARRVAQAVEAAGARAGVHAAAADFSRSHAHAVVITDLRRLARLAREIDLLTAAHDTLYGGTGAIPLLEAQQQMTSLFASGVSPVPLTEWNRALLAAMDGAERRADAERARAATGALWEQRVDALTAARARAAQETARYVDGVPPATRNALRGHPVAGPALAQLAEQ